MNILSIFVGILSLIPAVNLLKTKIVISGSCAEIYPPQKIPLKSKPVEIDLAKVNKVVINRVTPLYKKNLNEEKITWREQLIIGNQFVVKGWVFSNLQKLITEVKKANPNVEISTSINTVAENFS